jgi:O-antigen ligase
MGLAPGLSVKNGILYIATVFIVFRAVVSGDFKMEMGSFLASYAALIGYAILTWVIVGLFVHYKGYNMLLSGITLKNTLVDPLIFFMTFLFGIRTSQDAIKISKVLAFACVLANIANLGAAFHFFPLEYMDAGGRMMGPLGEPNQYGDYIVMFFPLMCAVTINSKGFARWLWIAGIMVSMASLATTASRAAFVALVASGVLGAYMLRSYLSTKVIMAWFLRAVAVAVAIVAVVSIEFADLLRERFIGQSKSAGLGELSSGRTDFWVDVLDKLMSQPVAMITGFGFDSYDSMGFFFGAHNYYLAQWFNLGMPGLILGILCYVLLIREARRALPVALPTERTYLMAFVFSILALMVAVLFSELTSPMPYFWAYAGICMRIAVNMRAGEAQKNGNANSRVEPQGRMAPIR